MTIPGSRNAQLPPPHRIYLYRYWSRLIPLLLEPHSRIYYRTSNSSLVLESRRVEYMGRHWYVTPACFTHCMLKREIGSIHLSILGGRILIKDFTYHSSNQTIRVVKGQISWRYWIRAPADEDDLSHARVVGEDIGRTLKLHTTYG